jgi:selenocysteine-specific elongation factor
MIVATAGHVDHGKTSLVRALTGVDTDRLEEEKRRGLTIDLGFAYADFGGPELMGFVDVPGHERFVRNMLAGISAIDLALLVIAADDGPMPQTREHLAILELLGARRLAVVLTKIGPASAAQKAQAIAATDALLKASRFAGALRFEVETPQQIGIDRLHDYLVQLQQETPAGSRDGQFRLAIDRSFSVSGAGLVVTGAALSGKVTIGDSLIVSPLGIAVRVRGIHAHSRATETAHAGQRCALNIVGSDLRDADIGRGQWLVSPAANLPANRIDVRMSLLADHPRSIAHLAPVQVHIGSAAVNARLALLQSHQMQPGESGLAQLVLEQPVAALFGDRFVLRDPAAQRTIGGGSVIDAFAPDRGRRSQARLDELAALSLESAGDALQALLARSALGVDLERFERLRNLNTAQTLALRQAVSLHSIDARHQPGASASTSEADRSIALSPPLWQAWRDAVLVALASAHADHPDQIGPIASTLARTAALALPGMIGQAREGESRPESTPSDSTQPDSTQRPRTPPGRAQPRRAQMIANAAIRSLIDEQRMIRDGVSLRLPDHRAVLPPADQALLDALLTPLRAAGTRPPIVGELAALLGRERAELLTFMRDMARRGHLLPIAANRFFAPESLGELAAIAAGLAGASADGSFDAASYRDASGLGRNLTIEVLEFLDRSGITRRLGERRRLIGSD